MAAYDYTDPAMAGLIEGFGDARTVDPAILQEAVPFGQPLFGYRGDSAGKAWAFKKDVAKIVYSADFSASNSTVVTVNGVNTSAVVYATSHAATIAAVIAAIKAIPVSTANPNGVEAVLDPADTNNRTILVRARGVNITADSTTTGGTAITDTVTYASGQVFLGVHVFKHVDTTYDPAAKNVADVCRIGTIWGTTASGSGLKAQAPVYVADTGKFAASGAAISSARFTSNESDTAGLVRVEVLGKVSMTYGDIAF